MSFSSSIKEELSRHYGKGRHCNIAEIAAIINVSGRAILDSDNDSYNINIRTENKSVARKYFKLIKMTFGIDAKVQSIVNNQFSKKCIIDISIEDKEDVIRVLKATRLIKDNKFRRTINVDVIASNCCKRAYMRGVFLGAGSMSDPEKTYHLEIVNMEESHANELCALINSFTMDSKVVERKKYYIVYLKEGSQIVDLLNIMEAHIALMELENLRIIKEMRNNVNRLVNCETANLNKTVSAAIKQINDINYIKETVGLDELDNNLRELALLRLDNTAASLKELGEMLTVPVGKSGVNHRLRKISGYAEKLRDKGRNYCD